MKKTYLLALLVMVLVFGVGAYYFTNTLNNSKNQEKVDVWPVMDNEQSTENPEISSDVDNSPQPVLDWPDTTPENIEVSDLWCESFVKESSVEKYSIEDEEMFHLLSYYNNIKSGFHIEDLIAEYEYEYRIDKAFSEKKCSSIESLDKSKYAYNLCDIFVSKDYTRLDSFTYEEGDTKEMILQTFKSLDEGKLLSWAKDNIFYWIHNFEKNKTSIVFKFNEMASSRLDWFTYYKENWKDNFFKELDRQFLTECKKLNNEN